MCCHAAAQHLTVVETAGMNSRMDLPTVSCSPRTFPVLSLCIAVMVRESFDELFKLPSCQGRQCQQHADHIWKRYYDCVHVQTSAGHVYGLSIQSNTSQSSMNWRMHLNTPQPKHISRHASTPMVQTIWVFPVFTIAILLRTDSCCARTDSCCAIMSIKVTFQGRMVTF